jgi:heme-degrading monooxygenase HmoA
MFARVVTIQGKPDRIDAAIRNFQEQIVPSIRKMNGFKAGYLLVDRKIGKTVVIALWNTEKDLQANNTAVAPLRAQAAQILEATNPPTVEIYEVAVQS